MQRSRKLRSHKGGQAFMRHAWTILAALLMVSAPAADAQNSSSPPSVVVQKAQTQKTGLTDSYVGRVEAVSTVGITARVQGTLDARKFTEGGLVKKGDVLFEIERDYYQSLVDQSTANVSGAQSTAKGAKVEYDRQVALLQRDDVPQSTVDASEATLGADQAAVKQAQAELEQAEINLGYTTITSPIDGRISKSNVDVGNLVGTNSDVLATITSVDPIYVSLYVSERDLIRKRQEGLVGQNSSKLSVQLGLSSGTTYPQSGEVSYISNQIDSATDTIEVRATFSNPDGLLVPGQVVTVTFEDPDAKDVIVIPQTAIQLDQKGHFVFVVNSNNIAKRQDVTLGAQSGRNWVVSSGLKVGDAVIVQGLQRVTEDEEVTPTESQS